MVVGGEAEFVMIHQTTSSGYQSRDAEVSDLQYKIIGGRDACPECGYERSLGDFFTYRDVMPAVGGGMVHDSENMLRWVPDFYIPAKDTDLRNVGVLTGWKKENEGSSSTGQEAFMIVERLGTEFTIRHWDQKLEGDPDIRDDQNYSLRSVRGSYACFRVLSGITLNST